LCEGLVESVNESSFLDELRSKGVEIIDVEPGSARLRLAGYVRWLHIYFDDDEVTLMDVDSHRHFGLSASELGLVSDGAATTSLAARVIDWLATKDS
jgi:hypothetical protein